MRIPTWIVAAFAVVAVTLAASTLWGGSGETAAEPHTWDVVDCRVMHDFEVDGATFNRVLDGAVGAWVRPDGTVAAWAAEEDEALWERPECVRDGWGRP